VGGSRAVAILAALHFSLSPASARAANAPAAQ
jgi:hypothetical protein